MTIEEKAKAYDEALELARDYYKANLKLNNADENLLLEDIFPELKESEDEKIRKALVRFHKSTIDIDGIKGTDILAWLEKQGEQNPTDKVEPRFKVKYAGSEYNVLEVKDIAGVTFYGIEDEPNHIDYVKAENCEIISGYAIKENGSPYPTKSAVFSEQKPAWSDEDEHRVEDTIYFLDTVKKHYVCTIEIDACIDWLKSLNNRIGG